MRLKLVLKIVEGTVLPCNYMYELSSCLYKVLNEGNPVFTAWLHDNPIEAIDAFVMGLFKNRQLEVGDRKSRVRFEVFNLERQAEPEFTSRMFFKTLSPMFIEEQLPETRKAIHLSPGNPKFAELLHLNLLDKYRVFYGQEPDPSWPLTRLHLLSEPKPKTIVLKVGTPEETRMKGYTFRFELEGQPELLRLGYEGGFGRLNSQGFGCVEVLKQ